MALFPEDSDARKTFPVYSGLLMYFPSALAAIARHSFVSNEKHNPGQALNHNRAKSGDEADALLRHLMEGDYVGMAWRALALLQKDLEAKGAPMAPAASNVAKAVAAAIPIPHDIAAAIKRDLLIERAASDDDAAEGNAAAPPAYDYGNPRTPVNQEDEE